MFNIKLCRLDPSKYIPNPITSHCLHCFSLGHCSKGPQWPSWHSVGLGIRSIDITWKLVRNADSLPSKSQTCWLRKSGGGTGELCFNKPSSGVWCTLKFNNWLNRMMHSSSLLTALPTSDSLYWTIHLLRESVLSLWNKVSPSRTQWSSWILLKYVLPATAELDLHKSKTSGLWPW